MFSVCVLLYGDYPELARRTLESIEAADEIADFRIGMNACSQQTREFVHTWALRRFHYRPVYLYEDAANRNLGKYPLMRQMLRDRTCADRIMWFDDDTFIDADKSWWTLADRVSRNRTQVGAIHTIMQRKRQHEVIRQQPWYAGKLVNEKHRFQFVTGGWWIANTAFLLQWDYPFPAIHHNGGDSILGELIRQQGGTMVGFPQGAQCHCENCRRPLVLGARPVVHINVGGRKGRRGMGVKDERYVWADGDSCPCLLHQSFELKITRYEC